MKPEDLINDRERELMEPYYKNRKPFRKKLQKVCQIYDPLEALKKENSTVYMTLDPILTDEMCEVMMHMKWRTPMYPEEIAERAGMPVEYVVKVLSEVCVLGPLEYYPDENGVDRFYMPQLCVGALEWCMAGDAFEEHPEESLLFEHHTYELFDTFGPYLPLTNGGVHRTVPIETALTSNVQRMEWEELSKLIENNSEDKYCVCKCICRRGNQETGKSSGEPSLEWCTAMGHLAEYFIRTGKGREITKEEFMNILKESENRGFVHNVANANGKDTIEYICNCDYKTCYTLRADLYSNNSSMTRSNFIAQVDPEKCVACGRCVEYCPMNATRLGQRLDPKSPLYYHYIESAHNKLVWGKDHYSPDYLYERKNVWTETGTAPCKTNCPAHIAVEGYLHMAAQGKYDEALKLIKYNNPLPAICGTICNRRCESACTRGKIDSPVAIDDVKKFLAYRELNAENRYIPRKKETWSEGKKVAVIGAGPAGLSCAYFLQIEGENVTVFEKNKEVGGMLRYGIPAFKLEKNIIDAEVEVIKELGAEFRMGVEVGKDITIAELRKQGYEAIYIAIGCQGGRMTGVPGEDAEGVYTAVDFLRSIADNGSFDMGENVVVVGGGNVAIDVSRSAIRNGAKTVTQLCLESRETMPASDGEVAEAEEDGIVIKCGWGPKEILTENGKVTGIVFKKCLSVTDSTGKFNPSYDEEDTLTIPCSQVILSVGQSIVWGDLLNGTKVELGRGNGAVADGFTYQTAEPDIFVGGDVYTGPKFAIDAIAAGKEAAESIHRFVWNGNLRSGRDNNIYKDIDKDNVVIESYDNASRQIPVSNGVLSEEQVKLETGRCLKCGAAHVDENRCIGCAVCTTKCEFDAIHIRKVFETEPYVREDQKKVVAKEVARKVAWRFKNKEKPVLVKVGKSNIDPDVSYAVGAVYHKPKEK